MNEITTTALYLFSSLLQADAAILGFGSIFVIYKLQSLESRYQQAFQISETLFRGSDLEMLPAELATSDTDGARASILKKCQSIRIRPQMELIVLIPKRTDEIKGKIKAPALWLSTHAIACAVFLWFSPIFAMALPVIWIVALTTIGAFAYSLFSSAKLAWTMLNSPDNWSLKEMNPYLYQLVNDVKK